MLLFVVYCVFVLTNGPVLCKKRGGDYPKPMQATLLIPQLSPSD